MTKDELVEEFTEYAYENMEDALQVITGLFIVLSEAYIELRSSKEDSEKQIDIGGPDGQRRITIHAVNGD